MNAYFTQHPKTKWTLAVVAGLLLILLALSLITNWNWFRGPLARMLTAQTGRNTSIGGDLRVHLWSLAPEVQLEGLSIDNPDWAKHRVMFAADRIAVSVSLGRLLRGQIVLPKVEVDSPAINLERDRSGRASWEFSNPKGKPPPANAKATKLPSVRLLIIQKGTLDIADAVKKLAAKGTLTAAEKAGDKNARAFQLRSSGTLNEKPFKLEFNGGPLVNLSPDQPYSFDMSIVASTIHAAAGVTITKPFDLSVFTAHLELSGKDLADAYYLTGLALPNTADYAISGDVHRTDALFKLDALKGRIGKSDIEGSMSVDTSKKRLDLHADLASQNLNFADLAPTLGAQPEGSTGSLTNPPKPKAVSKEEKKAAKKEDKLLPDADLQLNRVRAMDADVTYHAASVTAPKLPLKAVNFHLLLRDGVLKIKPLSFELAQGRFAGNVEIDAHKDIPESAIDMRIEDVDLSQFKSAKATSAPLSGTLRGRFRIHGSGSSIHKLASTADGGIVMAIPHGEVSNVLAELTGVNVLKGLGLLFSAKDTKAEIRCGVVDLQVNDGMLNAKSVFVDTTNVLITGRGNAQLGSEDLDLSFQGDPKHLRFVRLRAPVSLTGTMANPSIGIKPEQLAIQTGAAVALGVFLTPIASALAFIDPGLAKDENCAGILGEEGKEIAAPNLKSPSAGTPLDPNSG